MLAFLTTRWALAGAVAMLLVALVGQSPLGAAFAATDVYELPADAVLPKDLYVVANSVVIDGAVQGDLAVIARRVVVRGSVSGTTNLAAARIELQGARLGGVLRTVGATLLEPLGTGQGRVLPASLAPRAMARQDDPTEPERGGFVPLLLLLVGFAALAGLLLTLVPRSLIRPAEALHQRPWRTLGVGLLTTLHFLLLPLGTLLLAVLVAYFWDWFPAVLLIILVMASFGLLWFMSPLVTGVWAGRWLNRVFKRADHERPALVLGVVLIALVGQLPTVGWIVYLASFILAVGALTVASARAGAQPLPATEAVTTLPRPAAEGAEG